ncbi:MAG TPA: signal peptidase II [Chloroflexota bacterium]|nr:signal peptidase II [Chloroflexota bacterium]
MTEQSRPRNVDYGMARRAEPILPSSHPGLRHRPSHGAMVRRLAGSSLVAAFVLVADQITKSLSVRFLVDQPEQSVPILGDFARLTYVSNRGAAFGILQDRTIFFVIVGLVVIGVILASYRYFPVTSVPLRLALGLQLGGAIGNLVDRVRFGYVVDFIDVAIWPVFNLADSAIVVGVGILAFHLLRSSDARES